ncbi:MAG: hypothetical protein COV29_02255 [Candidatus Yanofskybacteria bacterium CG10_big_fil_rev_8_21_14_0_10_36_16]|uniref:Glycosyl transferase family 1 domain-containing protein n=1 Tax=Candidatus Yanofskybacteria bacterium CG10_big_fil_rev_8_21_14_0_10_36_16 TaxID=1975096 RepID=A0A2J0Q7Q8_9BACT|nr:MAG: hypothetical protein COV29_02255 [Candidatus Yanofskybacteria bacterium CG10_big_fil_rev_8_21_14_0_10_36_16]
MTGVNKKRILIFSTAYLPYIGGAEFALKELTDRLSDGFEFDLITAKMDKKLLDFEKVGNINVYRIGNGGCLDKIRLVLSGYSLAKKLHEEHEYGLVFSLLASYGGMLALRFKKKYSYVPFVVNLQEGRNFSKAGKIKMFIFKKIIKEADFVIAISNFLKGVALENGADERKIKIIPNGVDVEKFSRECPYREISELKDKLEIKPGDRIIISISRLTHKNALDTLIKSMPFLADNYKLVLVGDGEDKSDLAVLVMKLNLSDRVIFTGSIDHDELPKYLKISHVFARPSRSEGMGISFLEAMAAEIPVVATPVGGIIDFITDSETGVFCGVDDEESVAEKIKLLTENKELRDKIVRNAFSMVKERYDWDNIAKKYSEILTSFINE